MRGITAHPAFSDQQVSAFFDLLDPESRRNLLEIRSLIFAEAANLPDPADVEESLKWGEPSYRLAGRNRGKAVRINRHKSGMGKVAFFFHCRTGLIEQFREQLGDSVVFEGSRAVVLQGGPLLDADIVRHLVHQTFIYTR